MHTMFPRSVSVEQAKKKKKICKFIIFPPIYLTPLLENEQKAYCQADRPGQNVTVCSTWAQKYIKQRKPLHDYYKVKNEINP